MANKLNSKELYFKLFNYVKPMWPLFLLSIVASVCHSGVDAYIITLMQPLVDKGLVARDYEFIKYLPFLIPLLFLIRGAFGFISDYGMAWVSRRLILNIRSDLFKKYLNLPTSFFDNHNSGELLSKIIYNADQLNKACTDIVVDVVREGFLIVFLFASMLYTSWRLTLVFFICGPIMGILFVVINKLYRKISHRTQDAIGVVMHNIREGIDGQQEIRIYGGYEFITNRVDQVLKHYNKREMRQALVKAISVPTVQVIGGTALALTLYVALTGKVDPGLSAGAFSAIFMGMAAILKPIKQVTNVNVYLQRALAAAESIFAITSLPPEVDNGTYSVSKAPGKIQFKNITFDYLNRSALILDNINLEIKAKQTVAFVGHSGAGKSTLIKLLPRFYDNYTGDIYLDDINIKDYKLANLRDQMAIVSQNVVLFNDTIASNIAYGQSIIDMDQVIAAARAAGAYEFITNLPNSFDTLIGENGILLSGGQRQRLAIARAIYKDAAILILDEATSALDSKVEREIQQALDNLMANRTTLVIAHRLSTIINSDLIVVMDSGRIIETGTHSELLAKNGSYSKLYKLQFDNEYAVDNNREVLV